MKLNCIIVDDEAGGLIILEQYLSRLKYAEMSGKFLNAIDAFHFIKNNKVDVILLDINMPQVNGFGLLEMLEQKPVVIFTTAYSDYAMKAFDYNAVDYLYKPIRFERFVISMEKALKWCSIPRSGSASEDIEIKTEGRFVLLKTTSIFYIESRGNYMKLYTQTDVIMVLMTMKEIEDKLPRNDFVRVHKSYIVNYSKIKEIKNEQILVGNEMLPIGKTYKKYFLEFLKARA